MEGCFADLGTTAVIEHELHDQPSSVHSHQALVRKKLKHWEWPPSKASAELHPLLSCGWAFQERILSLRVLHFCKEELLWECREKIMCECGSLPELL